jgi:pimeloyl-ACP methyl ester carboxylesterase
VTFASWDEAAAAFAARFGDMHPAYGHSEWLRYAKRVARETPSGIELDYDMAIADPFKAMDDKTAAAGNAWPLVAALNGRPVLILRGEHSDLLSPDVAERMSAAVAGAELVTVPGVGHAPDFDEPESIAAVDRLLERVLAAKR